jgi:hypothetical protein
MQFFQELGALVERRWSDENYAEAVFPDIAAKALAETSPNQHVTPWDIIRWVNNATELPEQFDVEGRFGNPPITLYAGPRFYIDVYYWLDGTTSTHQHAFCGAFQVLLGSSIHSQYCFEDQKRINAHFSTGKIALQSVNLLGEGDIQKILPGSQYIHSLFHLDRPSATITIRTRFSPEGAPQFDYHKPHFAIDPFYKSAAMIKKVQSASLLLSMKHPEADELIGEALAGSDFQTAFAIVEVAFNHLTHDHIEKRFGLSTGRQRFEAYLEIVRRRHGELADLILPVIEESQRQTHIAWRRQQITSNEHRFFLALLLNVPDKARFLGLVGSRYPDSAPVETVTEWVEDLASTRVAGSSESNVLGIPDFDEDYLLVFRCLLEGHTLDQIRDEYDDDSPGQDSGTSASKAEALYHSIRTSMLFKSIFLDSPSVLPITHSTTV